MSIITRDSTFDQEKNTKKMASATVTRKRKHGSYAAGSGVELRGFEPLTP